MEPIQRSRLEKIKKEMLYYSYSFLFVLDTKANIILQHVYDLIFFLYYFGLQTFFSNTLFISYIFIFKSSEVLLSSWCFKFCVSLSCAWNFVFRDCNSLSIASMREFTLSGSFKRIRG